MRKYIWTRSDEQFLKLLRDSRHLSQKYAAGFCQQESAFGWHTTIVGTNHLKYVSARTADFDVTASIWANGSKADFTTGVIGYGLVIDENDLFGKRYIQLRVKDLQYIIWTHSASMGQLSLTISIAQSEGGDCRFRQVTKVTSYGS
jgi:hypothetical protein